MNQFLKNHKLPKYIHITQDKVVTLNNPINIKEIEFILKHFLKKKSPGSDGFPGRSYQAIIEEIALILHNFI